jgi:prepilin-type N-terminal cleavage/methylation domain-containing protein
MRRTATGLTLIELLITLVVMASLLYMAFANFNSSVDRENVTYAAQQTSFAIKNARYYAKRHGVITEVRFPAGSKEYRILVNDQDITDTGDFGAGSGTLDEAVKILTNTCGDFYFYIDGTPITALPPNLVEMDSACEISVGYSDSKQKTLKIYPGTGKITYE